MLGLLRYSSGSVRIRVLGGFAGRFLTCCAEENIPFWNAVPADGCLEISIGRRNFPKLRKFRRECGVKLKIIGKYGAAQVGKGYRRRLGIVIGVVASIILFWGLTQFVWSIQISGNERLSREEVLYALERCGVTEGMWKRDFDFSAVSRRIFCDSDDISWIALNTRGTTLYVELRERVFKPDMLPVNQPCNVTAGFTGQIIRMQVYDGQPAVKRGDGVVKGQLLISGVCEDREGAFTLCHARGSIVAIVQTVQVERVEYAVSETITGGVISSRFSLRLFGKEIPLFFDAPSGCTVRSERQVKLFGTELPIYWVRIDEYDTIVKTSQLTREQAENVAFERLLHYESDALGDALITNRTTAVTEDSDGIYMTAIYTCEREIGIETDIKLVP